MDLDLLCVACNWANDFWDWIAAGAVGAAGAAYYAASGGGQSLPDGDEENANESDWVDSPTNRARRERGLPPVPPPNFPDNPWYHDRVLDASDWAAQWAQDMLVSDREKERESRFRGGGSPPPVSYPD